MNFWDSVQKLSAEYWENEEVFGKPSKGKLSKKERLAEKKKFLEGLRNTAGLVLMVVFLGGGLGLAFLKAKTGNVEIVRQKGAELQGSQSSPSGEEKKMIKVHLSGAVVKPGLYELPLGSRVNDLLTAAGGLSGEADVSWTEKRLNLAAKLSDEEKIYIPKEGEATKDLAAAAGGGGKVIGFSTRRVSGKININTASAGQLETLPGIGPAFAARIVKYREKEGPFSRIEEIKRVSGIGPKTFEKFKDKISVD